MSSERRSRTTAVHAGYALRLGIRCDETITSFRPSLTRFSELSLDLLDGRQRRLQRIGPRFHATDELGRDIWLVQVADFTTSSVTSCEYRSQNAAAMPATRGAHSRDQHCS